MLDFLIILLLFVSFAVTFAILRGIERLMEK